MIATALAPTRAAEAEQTPDLVAQAEAAVEKAANAQERSNALVALGQAYLAKREEDKAEAEFKAAWKNAEVQLKLESF